MHAVLFISLTSMEYACTVYYYSDYLHYQQQISVTNKHAGSLMDAKMYSNNKSKKDATLKAFCKYFLCVCSYLSGFKQT
jgi:hypothetical protein